MRTPLFFCLRLTLLWLLGVRVGDIIVMKSLWLITSGAALAVIAQPVTVGHGAHRHHKVLAHYSGYYVPYVTGAAGRPVPIMQIPGSVTVVPREVIDDQQDITICGALRNVSGVLCR